MLKISHFITHLTSIKIAFDDAPSIGITYYKLKDWIVLLKMNISNQYMAFIRNTKNGQSEYSYSKHPIVQKTLKSFLKQL